MRGFIVLGLLVACQGRGAGGDAVRVLQTTPTDIRTIDGGTVVSGTLAGEDGTGKAVETFAAWFTVLVPTDGDKKAESGRGSGELIGLGRNIDTAGGAFFFDRGNATLIRGTATDSKTFALPCTGKFPAIGAVSGTRAALGFAACDVDAFARVVFFSPEQSTLGADVLGVATPTLFTSNETSIAAFVSRTDHSELRVYTSAGELQRVEQRTEAPTLAALGVDQSIFTVTAGKLSRVDTTGKETLSQPLAIAPIALAASQSGVFVLGVDGHLAHYANTGGKTAEWLIESPAEGATPRVLSVRSDGGVDVAGTFGAETIVTWRLNAGGVVIERAELNPSAIAQ